MKRPNKRLFVLFFYVLGLFPLLAQYTSDDWKARDRWMRISEFLEITAVDTDMQVADIGAHEYSDSLHGRQ